MNTRILLATAAIFVASAPASALTITLRDVGSGPMSADAARGYRAAAAYWESVITTNVNVNIDVSFDSLGAGVLGSTQSSYDAQTVFDVTSSIRDNGTSALDLVVKNNLAATNLLAMITPGYTDPALGTGIDNTTKVYDTGFPFGANSINNLFLGITTANGKALGFGGGYDANDSDAEIGFSSDFAPFFDFDPRNGIGTGRIDFIGVAIHEFGHALGFVSSVDDYDFYGTGSPIAEEVCIADGTLCKDLPTQQFPWGSSLDLFRYSNDPTNLVAGSGAVLDWTTGTASYFSIDGGATNLGNFATGEFNGDEGDQASHWNGPGGCTNFLGIMNPYICGGVGDSISALDLAAFDAIGWQLNVDVIGNPGYSFSTAQAAILGGVPEPTTWAMMIAGFGLVGAARRRASRVSVAT